MVYTLNTLNTLNTLDEKNQENVITVRLLSGDMYFFKENDDETILDLKHEIIKRKYERKYGSECWETLCWTTLYHLFENNENNYKKIENNYLLKSVKGTLFLFIDDKFETDEAKEIIYMINNNDMVLLSQNDTLIKFSIFIEFLIIGQPPITQLILNDIFTNISFNTALIYAFEKTTTLKKLWITNLDNNGMRVLADIMRKNESITLLSLSYNNFDKKGLALLVDALKENYTLQSLNLSYNGISDIGVIEIMPLLRTSLIELNLSDNNISDYGAKLLSKGLTNTILQKIDLSDNVISDKGAMDLLISLKDNLFIRDFYLDGNGIKDIEEMQSLTNIKLIHDD
jgi:hypothetical protein